MTQSWRYLTNNLDAVNWTARAYPETRWSNLSPALFYITEAALAYKNTALPERDGGGPMLTYYFRTSFNVTNAAEVLRLDFVSFIDDGAIFYLNGAEIQRVGVDSTNYTYSSLAGRTVGDATVADRFSLSGDWLTNLVTGDNILAVEVHQDRADSTDVAFGCALVAFSGSNLERGPYLQSGTPTSVVVRWRTIAPVAGWVRFATNLATLVESVLEGSSTNEHEVKLTGLRPDTKYFYSVGAGSAVLAGGNPEHFFVTSPVPGTPKATRVWVIGDSGTGSTNQINVRNAYEAFTGARHTDLWLMLGDNAYDSGTDLEHQRKVFTIYTNQLRESVVWPTLGNHDTDQAEGLSDAYPYFNVFTLPKNGEAGGFGSGSEHYYSFDYGNIHFICLDSVTAVFRATNSVMFTWLTNDLANVTADWTIAYWHQPPYSKGTHDSDSDLEMAAMRAVFLPVLENAGVDLVLCGHSHDYERSFLLDQQYGPSWALNATNKLDAGSGREAGSGAYKKPEGGPISHQGTVYAVVGSSGQLEDRNFGLNHPAMYVSLNLLGSLVLDIVSNQLDAKFIRDNGTTNDSFTIVKLNYPPTASNLTFAVAADTATNLWFAGDDRNHNPLTYITNSLRGRGLISNFDPSRGTFTYTPAHGFSGLGTFTYSISDGLTSSPLATMSITVLPPADLNTNGLPDYWEAAWKVSDPSADDDGDGLNNLQEYLANTNPTNAASHLCIIGLDREVSSFFTIKWDSVGGTRYRVSFSDGEAWGDFTGVFTELSRPVTAEMDPAPVGTPSTMSFTDDFTLSGGPPANGTRYYRIQVVK